MLKARVTEKEYCVTWTEFFASGIKLSWRGKNIVTGETAAMGGTNIVQQGNHAVL